MSKGMLYSSQYTSMMPFMARLQQVRYYARCCAKRGNKRWSQAQEAHSPSRKSIIQTEKLLKIQQWKAIKDVSQTVVHRGWSHRPARVIRKGCCWGCSTCLWFGRMSRIWPREAGRPNRRNSYGRPGMLGNENHTEWVMVITVIVPSVKDLHSLSQARLSQSDTERMDGESDCTASVWSKWPQSA